MKFLFLTFICLTQLGSNAQLKLKGDTIVYAKSELSLKQLLPKEIAFVTLKTTKDSLQKKYSNIVFSNMNNDKNFALRVPSKDNKLVNYIFVGKNEDKSIEGIRVTCPPNLIATIFPKIGAKTATEKNVDYWFFHTKDNYKVYLMQNNVMNNAIILIGINPANWEHIMKK